MGRLWYVVKLGEMPGDLAAAALLCIHPKQPLLLSDYDKLRRPSARLADRGKQPVGLVKAGGG
jgi:hypothetical protein